MQKIMKEYEDGVFHVQSPNEKGVIYGVLEAKGKKTKVIKGIPYVYNYKDKTTTMTELRGDALKNAVAFWNDPYAW